MTTRGSVAYAATVNDVDAARMVIIKILGETSMWATAPPSVYGTYPPETYDYVEVLLSLKSAEILALKATQKHGLFSTLHAMFVSRDILNQREVIAIEQHITHVNRILDGVTMRDGDGCPLDTEEDFRHVSLLAEEALLYSSRALSLLMDAYLERDRSIRKALLMEAVDRFRLAEDRMKTLARPTCGDLIEIIESRVS